MIENLVDKSPSWLSSSGPYSDILIYTRAGLFRNLSGYYFNRKADEDDREEILNLLIDALNSLPEFDHTFKTADLSGNEIKFLKERDFFRDVESIDREFRGISLNEEWNRAVSINGEEHVEIFSISPGLSVENPVQRCDGIDDDLSKEFDFAFDEDTGYLTSSVKRVGTGLEISAVIHLPAVVITGRVGDLLEELQGKKYKMNGIFNTEEGVQGSLFRIRSDYSLGVSEKEMVEKTSDVLKDAVQNEMEAREYLTQNVRYETEDKVWRSYGIMKNVRLLNLADFLNLISALRLGSSLGILKDIETDEVNRLMMLGLPGHLNMMNKGLANKKEENILRAKVVRENLGG